MLPQADPSGLQEKRWVTAARGLGEGVVSRAARGHSRGSRFPGARKSPVPFLSQGVPGRTCSHEQEISHATNKLTEKKTRKPGGNPGPEDKNTPEVWPPGLGGGTRPGHMRPSARWTPCPALPVTFRSQSSWSSYSAFTESQCQPILQIAKLMGHVGVECGARSPFPESGHPTHHWAVSGGQNSLWIH